MMNNRKYQPLGGYVTSSKDFIGKNRRIDPDGIFSEQIFGPINSYKCACGNYMSKILYENQVCPKCGVICGNNDIRYDIFGKIKLIFPVIRFKTKDKFLRIIGNEKNLINPNRADYLSSTQHYIGVKLDKSSIKIVKTLQSNDHLVIPFRITGLYSLYIVLKFIHTYMNVPCVNQIFDNNYIIHELKVLPPNLRIVTYDPTNKTIRSPEINKKYLTIIRKNTYNRIIELNLKDDEQLFLDKIRHNLKQRILDEDIVEPTIIEYDLEAAKYQWSVNEIYEFVYDELSGKPGMIRSSILARIIEFSARSVIRIDPSLEPYQIRVSKHILRKLWLPYFIYYLKTIKNIEYDRCYDNVILKNNLKDEFEQYFNDFLIWMMEDE